MQIAAIIAVYNVIILEKLAQKHSTKFPGVRASTEIVRLPFYYHGI